MPDNERPAGLTLTLRAVPTDVVLAIKRCVMEHNATHPEDCITQTDVVAWAVRAWAQDGNGLSTGISGE